MESKIHFRENWLTLRGFWGEAELILRIWGAKGKYFQEAEEFSFWYLGKSMHLFQASREHRPLGASFYTSTILLNQPRNTLLISTVLERNS